MPVAPYLPKKFNKICGRCEIFFTKMAPELRSHFNVSRSHINVIYGVLMKLICSCYGNMSTKWTGWSTKTVSTPSYDFFIHLQGLLCKWACAIHLLSKWPPWKNGNITFKLLLVNSLVAHILYIANICFEYSKYLFWIWDQNALMFCISVLS